MVEHLTPGAYAEEFDSGQNTTKGVSTSTAGFIGQAVRGPISGKPVLITSPSEYRNVFGEHLNESFPNRYLSYALDQFFTNGGSRAYVMRVASEKDKSAALSLTSVLGELHLTAKNEGSWGNSIKFSIRKEQTMKTNISYEGGDEAKKIYAVNTFTEFHEGDVVELADENQKQLNRIIAIHDGILEMEVPFTREDKDSEMPSNSYLYRVGFECKVEYKDIVESYHVTFNDKADDDFQKMISKGLLIQGSYTMKEPSLASMEEWLKSSAMDENWQTFYLQGGVSAYEESADLYIGKDNGPGQRTGLCAFQEVEDVSILCIPGVTNPEVQRALIEHCESNADCFAILDFPQDASTMDELLKHRSYFDTSFGACYHPWLQHHDELLKREAFFPPSGSIAGIYARVDQEWGIHRAPANVTITRCTGLSINYNETEQERVNLKGINLIRRFLGRGICVWGAKTMSNDGNLKYINVRRLLIYIEKTIRANISWAVFEPNDSNLWLRVESDVKVFLNTLWRDGALAGFRAEDAFFVNIGESTMTQDDILHGRLICEIGIAAVHPAVFETFKIIQNMQDA